MEFELCVVNNFDDWNKLIENSLQGNIFQNSLFLNSLKIPFKCYFVKSNNLIYSGVIILENENKMYEYPPFCPYQGIIFSELVSNKKNHSRIPLEFKISEFIISELLKKYTNFFMSLSPSFEDIRPFLWHNYGKNNLPKFEINNLYTAILRIKDKSYDDFLSLIRSNKRYEIKKSNVIIKDSTDINSFIDIYKRMFERQNIKISDTSLEIVNSIATSALLNNYGWLKAAFTENGSISSMSLFLNDKKNAYYLFGANEPKLRREWGSSALMASNIKKAINLGLDNIDFVGANSPNRSDYKISFNAKLISYFSVFLK